LTPLAHHDFAQVLIQVVVILAVSRVLSLAANALGQPAVMAETLAGILLGPSLLGRVSPAAFESLFPATSMPELRLLSQLGLVLFMFLVGLELDVERLRGRARAPALVGLASIAVPLAAGLLGAPWLHARYGGGVSMLPFSLFIGAAMSVTAFPVLARILSERHLLGSRVGAMAIACAAVDDVVAWCLLTLLVASTQQDGWLRALGVALGALALVALTLVLLRPILARSARRIERGGVGASTVSAIVFGLLLVAAISEVVGVHALFAAFLLGAVLPKQSSLTRVLSDKLEGITVALFLPLVFAYSGLRTELALVGERADLVVLAVVIAVATTSKLGGSALVARLTGLSWRDAGVVGILLNVRGLMGLVVLNVGLDLGIVSPPLFAIFVVTSLVTTWMASPLLRIAYPDTDLVRERFVSAERDPVEPVSPERSSEVLVACVSDPSSGPPLASLAHALARSEPFGTRVFGLHLEEPSSHLSPGIGEEGDEVSVALNGFLQAAQGLGLEARGLAFVSSTPAEDIVRIADAKRASWILLGAHTPWGLEGRLDGVVRSVLRSATVTVAVLVGGHRLAPGRRIERVLVAHAAPDDDLALEMAARLSGHHELSVTVLSLCRPGGPPSAALPERTWRWETQVTRDPRDALISAASEHRADLIVVSSSDQWQLSADRLGGSRRSLFERAKVPLLVVHNAPGVPSAGAGTNVQSEERT
jgi:Kef-type K+ transport system membrane component KefB/nucleotide-binding universal stress UspA family protein